MNREEKRRRFHESLIQMLYPPPPKSEEDKDPVNIDLKGYDLNQFQDLEEEEGKSVNSEEDEEDCGSQKLTRAQRKRLRKKKLHEASWQRRKMIGPLLPATSDEDDHKNDPEGVRRNAPEKLDVDIHHNGELGSSSSISSQKKIKHRRVAKKLAKEIEKKTNSVDIDNHQCLEN